MYNYHNRKKFIYSLFLLLLLAIGIGYAYLTSNLSISGNTQVSTNTWNIHFQNLNVTTGSVITSTPATINAAGDAITYTINLNRPKEFYEFTVDVKNDGTLPCKITVSTLSGITTAAEPIIDYSIKYTNGNPVNIGDIINASAKRTIKVRVFYKDEIDPEDFPNDDLTLALTYTLQYVQSKEDGPGIFDDIVNLASNNSCITKYEGNVTDSVNDTKAATNVYFDKCSDKRNVIFGGYCWQVIRTTETGGIKMLYNGEPVDEQCLSSRPYNKGISTSSGSGYDLSEEYLYGNSFTYDLGTSTFTLIDTFNETWSDSTYLGLIGKYTCKSSSNTCDRIYYPYKYWSNTEGMMDSYWFSSYNDFSQIGYSRFGDEPLFPGRVGYMYNKEFVSEWAYPGTNEYKYGSTFTYANGTYTLSGATQNISDWSTGYNQINNTHYTCWNTSGTCNEISFIFKTNNSTAYYYKDTNGDGEDILGEMLYNDDINQKDSRIKILIDIWYAKYLNEYTNLLEKSVYCNPRNITSAIGWNPEGGNTYSNDADAINYKNNSLNNDLTCSNITDQFSVDNNKAKLTYPVALLSIEELYNLDSDNLRKSGKSTAYWSMSPSYSNYSMSYGRRVGSGGSINYISVGESYGVRPAISLKGSNEISSGTGSESDPWIID